MCQVDRPLKLRLLCVPQLLLDVLDHLVQFRMVVKPALHRRDVNLQRIRYPLVGMPMPAHLNGTALLIGRLPHANGNWLICHSVIAVYRTLLGVSGMVPWTGHHRSSSAGRVQVSHFGQRTRRVIALSTLSTVAEA